jgi:putative ABC transport system permease protein
VIFMPLTTAQRLFHRKEQITSVQIVLHEGAALSAVEERVRSLLPGGLTVQTPATRGEFAQNTLYSTELSLGCLSLVSLVAGAFVILNSFQINLGERRRQLAVLRALGATRRQMTWLLLREATFLGLAGTLLGTGLGVALSMVLRQVMEQVLGVTLPSAQWTVTPFLVALFLGPGMALAATFVPARRAGRRSPLLDLLHRRGQPHETVRRWSAYLGLGLFGAMLCFALPLIFGWIPVTVAASLLAPAVALGLSGCVLAMPLLLPSLFAVTAPLVKLLFGLEGSLALRQLARHPSRTALTVGILVVSLVVSIGFGQSMRNSVYDIYEWCDSIFAFDFMVRGVMPDTTTLITTAALPEDLEQQLAGMDGVARADKISFVSAKAEGRQIVVLPFTVDDQRVLPFKLVAGQPDAVTHGLQRGDVVLATTLAQRLDKQVGDEVTLETRHGPRRLRIAGTVKEYTLGGMCLYLEWKTGQELFDIQGVHVFAVRAREGAAASVAPRLEAFCRDHGLRFQDRSIFRQAIDNACTGVINLYWGLVVLVYVVASLGVVNTITMNVLEQTRELGILRVVAMKRRQLSKLIFAQAITLAFVALVPGVSVGIALAFLMNLGARPILGMPIAFHLDAGLVSGCALVALAIALAAAYFPARRAVRLPVIEALQYE